MSSFSDQVKGNWNQVTGKLKQQWGDLTDDDLQYEDGKEDEILGRIQEVTGEAKEKIKDFIDGLGFD